MGRERPVRILFLCTGNACRSQMAEALARHAGDERIEAVSAGSRPAGYIHPLAEATMEAMGASLDGQSSKSWDEFATTRIDIVITLCDAAAEETCPVWLGTPVRAHWGLADPVTLMASESERSAAAREVGEWLKESIEKLLALDLEGLPHEELEREVRALAP